MRSIIILACAALAVSPAFSKDYVVDVRANPDQQSQFVQGREAVVSRMPASSTLILEARDPFEKRAVMTIGVANNGTVPFNFGPENVTVTIGEQVVSMITYDELMREQKRREGRRRFAMALSGALNDASASYAGNTYGTTTYSGTTNGVVAGQPFSTQTTGMGTYSGHDATAAAIARANANAENARNSAALEANLASRRAQIEQVVQLNTIMPGRIFNGPVQFEVPDSVAKSKGPVPVVITVQAGDEIHTFQGLLGTSKAFRPKK